MALRIGFGREATISSYRLRTDDHSSELTPRHRATAPRAP